MAIEPGDAVILRESRNIHALATVPVYLVLAKDGNNLMCHSPLIGVSATLNIWEVRTATDAEKEAKRRLLSDNEYLFGSINEAAANTFTTYERTSRRNKLYQDAVNQLQTQAQIDKQREDLINLIHNLDPRWI